MRKYRVTIFNTPIVSAVLRVIAVLILRLAGWRTVGKPPDLRKYVLIAVPHTSNWDFPLMLAAVFSYRLRVYWMGKHTLFPPVLGVVMKWLGGVPIDRRQAANTVEQMADVFKQSDDLVLLITPEGTRSKVERWKAGFYHIAHRADVPILLAYVHAPDKEIGLGHFVTPTGDYEADIPGIQGYYKGRLGVRPELSSGCPDDDGLSR